MGDSATKLREEATTSSLAREVLSKIMDIQQKENNSNLGKCWIEGSTDKDIELDFFRIMRQEGMSIINGYVWNPEHSKHYDLNNLRYKSKGQQHIKKIMSALTSQMLTYANINNLEKEEMTTMWLDTSLRDQRYRNDVELLEYFIFSTLEEDLAVCGDLFFLI